jgi:hypothetical protein
MAARIPTTFRVYRDRSGVYRWRLRARNGRIVASSGESFGSRRAAERAVMAVVRAVVSAKGDAWL